ncbi:MAG: 3-dehydroquinate synthase [uncultured Thermomicrobiales bacterium]|uniref:Multifunctional fusion protein n=1 Tax=uncultured Thermomicrobiales bacterium TaxID=1645740 RepID=A0A6J4UJN7_9BACT|nr:MAG: 3-dehydroquinate synthase [uncultured Thermomicrobiales bacterium]
MPVRAEEKLAILVGPTGNAKGVARLVPIRRVVLVGLSGAGKSTVGRLVAQRLGWRLIDTDAEIEAETATTVPLVFRDRGEAAFRAIEREVLERALGGEEVVVACGGGAVANEGVWSPSLLGGPGTLVVALDADPETSLRRLQAQHALEGSAADRPLLAGADPLGRLAAMKAARRTWYERAAVTLPVDDAPAETIAAVLGELVELGIDAAEVILLNTPSGASRILVSPGALLKLGELTRERWPAGRRAWIVSDANVGPIFGPDATETLAGRGFDVRMFSVPSGESSKSVDGITQVWNWLLESGIERSDVVIALGGGVVGDLAGFAAATVLRGVGLVQVPTTLQAMVDASVGGKTGINHPAGKNLIGAFYQPALVIIDPVLLRTVPPRELRSGWAEVVKHAVIQRSTPGGERADLLPFLECNAPSLQSLGEPVTAYLIGRNVALKAAVVEADEKESGIRAYLNFGHTLGHGIEAAGYSLLHGEAVALGMRAAGRIGQALETCGPEWVARVDAALDKFDLPRTADVDPDRVLALLGSDKKRTLGRQRWVLPLDGGGVTVRDDVPEATVRSALAAVTKGGVRAT